MKNRGKMLKTATFALAYGSSVAIASRKTGLGLRRTKVLFKSALDRGYKLRN